LTYFFKGISLLSFLHPCHLIAIGLFSSVALASTEVPTRIAGIPLNENVPSKTLRLKDSPYPETFIISSSHARLAIRDELGFNVNTASANLLAIDGKTAEITLNYPLPPYIELRRKLSVLYGIGKQTRIAGENSCNDIEITTWKGKNATAILAIFSPYKTSKKALTAMLHFRSNSLYTALKAQRKVAYEKHYQKFDPPECSHQEW
jgi:hypothetical protein